MKLADHLALGTALVWVTTDEPGRVLDAICTVVEHRTVFRNDAISGLVSWDRENRRWLRVLVDVGGGAVEPTSDTGVVFNHVLDKQGILLMEHAHQTTEMLLQFYTSINYRFRSAFYADDADAMPAQFILLSHKDQVPTEIARIAAHVRHELPDYDELLGLASRLDARHAPLAARAAAGMGEHEFITTALVSLREHKRLDPEFISTHKLAALKRSGLLEVRTPTEGVERLGGLDNAKDLVAKIGWTWANPGEADEFGIEPLRRVLLVGVQGTGKSLLCEATASTLGLDLAKGGVSNAMNKFVGESEANMRRMFTTLKAMAPIVFWIDEFGRDMSGGASSGVVDGGTTDRVHGEFLTGLQELPSDIFLMAAANRIEDLPPEMLRADRFDKIMFVGFPTADERAEIFAIHLGERHVNYDLAQLAAATVTFTGAEIRALIREVRFNVGTGEKRHATTEDILAAVPHIKGRIWTNYRAGAIAMYERALIEWDWASSAQRAEAPELLGMAREPAASYTPKSFSIPKKNW